MGFYRCRRKASGLTETTLWENSSPSTNFSAQTISFSPAVKWSDYKYIKIYWCNNTSTIRTTYPDHSVILDSVDISHYALDSEAIALRGHNTSDTAYYRRCNIYNNSSGEAYFEFSTGYRLNNTGTSASVAIPTKITGLN